MPQGDRLKDVIWGLRHDGVFHKLQGSLVELIFQFFDLKTVELIIITEKVFILWLCRQ